MPKAESTRLAGSPSLTARMSGMPPATAASKPSITRLRRAASKISGPWWASSALLAVTTCLPASRALRMNVRAGSSPPTSSMTTWTAGSSSTSAASGTSGRRLRSRPSRWRVVSASAMACRVSRQPTRSCISAPWVSRTLTTPLPTVPRPRRPILISFMAGPGATSAAPSAGGERLEAPKGLFDPLLVLDEGKADEALAVLAEADARRDRDLALVDQELRELERAHGPERLRDRRPHEHGALGLRHRPADLVETLDEDIPAAPMELDDVSHHRLLTLEGDDGRDLDRLEGAVVQIRLDPGQRVDHARIAADEAHPPARHVVGLGHGEELHPHVLGPRHLEERGGLVAVEGEVRVGEVVHHHQVMLLGELHHLDEEVAVYAHRGRIVGEGQDQELGLGPGQLGGLLEAGEEIVAGNHGHGAEIPVRDHHRIGMDRIGWIGHQHPVARLKDGQSEMS